MTKEEYNELLKRFHKAEEWYNSNPPMEQQEKYLGDYVELLKRLNIGVIELKPNESEILGGFKN
ncbi:hypothetical protein [uncultured Tissierella sp.]|uniref:hypothetical protein n=1 Tax=uncultured Tissierella sp. TaxID=448160 RepID=UPI002805C2D4|nr:hypothetical protein [uncultured Tissierella sp.]MDU5081231.1 hypothetical protein [Bacillota bacterium]